MRKKTIEEELKEIAEEKDDHIENLHKEYMSSKDDHAYDFDYCDEKTKNRTKKDSLIMKGFQHQIDQLDEMEEKVNAYQKKKMTTEEYNAWLEDFKKRNDEIDAEFQAQMDEIDREVDEIVKKYENKKVSSDNNDDDLDDETDKEIPDDIKQEIQKQTQRRNKSNSIRSKLLLSVFFSVFVIVGLFVSITFGIKPWVKSSSFIATPATVIDVDYYYDSDGDWMGKFTFRYEFDGVAYEQKSSYSQSASLCPSIGEQITVYVNPNDPTDVLDSKTFNIIITFFGMIFVLAGGIPMAVMWFKKK